MYCLNCGYNSGHSEGCIDNPKYRAVPKMIPPMGIILENAKTDLTDLTIAEQVGFETAVRAIYIQASRYLGPNHNVMQLIRNMRADANGKSGVISK